MSTDSIPNPVAHPFHPVASSGDPGPGWRAVGIGEVVKTSYQVYSFSPKVGWRLSSFYTAEGFVNQGKSEYREAIWWRHRLRIAPSVFAKVISGYWRLVWHGRFV